MAIPQQISSIFASYGYWLPEVGSLPSFPPHDFYLKKWQPSTCPSFHLSLTLSISHSSSRRHYKLKLKMFTPKVSRHESFSKHRAGKTGSKRQRSFKNSSFQRFEQAAAEVQHQQQNPNPQISPSLTSAIITLCVGREQRLFAAHEDVLCNSPYFASICRNQFFESTRRIDLPEDEPEIFSSVLEYLYKGDYYPRLELDKRRRTWQLESMDTGAGAGTVESTVFVNGLQVVVLKDTVIYVGLTDIVFLHPFPLTHALVHSREIRPPSTSTTRPPQARVAIWRPMQHHSHFCPLRVRTHARQ